MDSYLDNLNRLNLSLSCASISDVSHFREVLQVKLATFPESMQDELSDIQEFFEDENAHGLILRKDKKPIGVIKGNHLQEGNTESDILESSTLKEIEDVTFYIAIIAVMKEARSKRALDFLIHEMALDLRRFDYQFATAHARVSNGVSGLLQKRYGAKVLASFDDWCEYGEPFDYVLIDLDNLPLQSSIRRKVYRIFRRIYRLFL